MHSQPDTLLAADCDDPLDPRDDRAADAEHLPAHELHQLTRDSSDHFPAEKKGLLETNKSRFPEGTQPQITAGLQRYTQLREERKFAEADHAVIETWNAAIRALHQEILRALSNTRIDFILSTQLKTNGSAKLLDHLGSVQSVFRMIKADDHVPPTNFLDQLFIAQDYIQQFPDTTEFAFEPALGTKLSLASDPAEPILRRLTSARERLGKVLNA